MHFFDRVRLGQVLEFSGLKSRHASAEAQTVLQCLALEHEKAAGPVRFVCMHDTHGPCADRISEEVCRHTSWCAARSFSMKCAC